MVSVARWRNFYFAVRERLNVSLKMLLHGGRHSWAGTMSRDRPTMKTKLEFDLRKVWWRRVLG